MSVETVDFYNIGYIKGTRPISLSFYGEVFTHFDYWNELYVKFFELALERDPEKIENLAWLSARNGGSTVLFIEGEEILLTKYKSLKNSNICVKINYNSDRLLGYMREVIELCGFDFSQIEVKYSANDFSELDDDYSNSLTVRPGNESFFDENSDFGFLTTAYQTTTRSYPSNQNYVRFTGYPSKYVAERIIRVLQNDYVQGFRFDGTTLSLLESRAQYTMNSAEEKVLKSRMYCRKDDGLFFLNESVASEDLCLRIAESVNVALQKFQCFELKTLYERFSGELNSDCIRNVEDFKDWFEDKFPGNIKGKNYDQPGEHRIVRVKSISQEDATSALVRRIGDELKKSFGTLEEENLLKIFDAFSIELLNDLVRKDSDDIIVCQINGRTCYQTFDALGIPEEFPEELSNVFEKVDELELEPTLETINVLLSVTFNFNFRNYFNIPNDKTYRRLIATYYQGTPREWKAGTFKEVDK